MISSTSLPDFAAALNRAIEVHDFVRAQQLLDEYRRGFDQAVERLQPEEAITLLTPVLQSIESARFAVAAAQSHIAAELAEITKSGQGSETRRQLDVKG